MQKNVIQNPSEGVFLYLVPYGIACLLPLLKCRPMRQRARTTYRPTTERKSIYPDSRGTNSIHMLHVGLRVMIFGPQVLWRVLRLLHEPSEALVNEVLTSHNL
jgi:hypothetical protein